MKKMFFIYGLIIFMSVSIFTLPLFYINIRNYYDIRCKEFNSFFEIYSVVPQPICYVEKYDIYMPLKVLEKRKDSIHAPIYKYRDKNL